MPVLAGAARRWLRPPVTCPEVLGESGLGGAAFPALPALRAALLPDTPAAAGSRVSCADAMAAGIVAAGAPVRLVATGALTNVALLLACHPYVRRHLADIVLMGGALGLGDTGPVAEFNMNDGGPRARARPPCSARACRW